MHGQIRVMLAAALMLAAYPLNAAEKVVLGLINNDFDTWTVTINGSGFVPDSTLATVVGRANLEISEITSTHITAPIPAGLISGTYQVNVTTGQGKNQSATTDWTIILPGLSQICVEKGGSWIIDRCWFWGAKAMSCEQVCAAYGGPYDDATESLVGDVGTTANCAAVASRLTGRTITASDVSVRACSQGMGCWNDAPVTRCTSPGTDSSTWGYGRRFCACEA